MGAFATMTSKGQLTIPKQVRDELGLKTGTRFHVTVRGREVIVRPKNGKLADLAGMLGRPPGGRSLTVEEMDEAVGEAVAEDWRDFERNRSKRP